MHAINPHGRRGFFDWMVQRVTAVIIGLYAVFIIAYLLTHKPLLFPTWQMLFHHDLMKAVTLIVLLSILWHAWIGLWTVLTDYVKPVAIRLFMQMLVILVLLASLAWMIEILWSVK
jgi:succinate dehydrogenase / fumarate reductase, membrane anchor subunit